MASITPPNKREVGEADRLAWHRTFEPHFDTMVAWGYLDGAYPLSYGSTITGVVGADGEVAFREGAVLAYGSALSASTVYLVSTSASDTGSYLIQGIDANGDYATATVTATGTTPVAVSGTWNHIQRLIHTSAGSNNVGTVYVSTDSGAIPSTTGDQIQVAMGVGDNYAINPELWCPNNMTITINTFDFSTSANQTATIRLLANRQGQWILNFKFFTDPAGGAFTQNFHTPLRLFAGDKLRVLITAGGGSSTNGSFGMNGVVLDATALDTAKAGIGTVLR